jgi:hypothetical protein
MVKVGESQKILNLKTGEPLFGPRPSAVRRLLKRVKIAVYYPLAALFEKRRPAAGIFKYVMAYYYTLGIERSRGGR